MGEKRKIKICDFDGRKLDTAIVINAKEANIAIGKWKRKGWL